MRMFGCVLHLTALLSAALLVSGRSKVRFGDHFGKHRMKSITTYDELPSPEVFYR